jgi:hypothetical protein
MLFSKSRTPIGFYVYLYLREDGSPYYVGKGKSKRAWIHQRGEAVHPPKDHERIKIVAHRLDEHESFLLEILLIKQLGRKDKSTGILRNLSDGGQGPSGLTRSTETRQRMSHSKKGIPSKLKGKPKSPETVEKMRSAGAKRRGKKNPKITASKLGKPSALKGKNIPHSKHKESQPLVSCLRCGFTGGINGIKRYHFDRPECPKKTRNPTHKY